MKAQRFIAVLLALLLSAALFPAAYAQEPETPSEVETGEPTASPSEEPTTAPTETPTTEPTEEPTASPTTSPTAAPTATPSIPVITKHPTGESIRAGGAAMFIARADNYSWCAWRFYDKEGAEIVFDKIWGYFPNLRVSGGNGEEFTISNVPLDMNGWSVACLFSSEDGDWEYTSKAKITVTAATPSPKPTATPTPKPSASPTAVPSPSASVSPAIVSPSVSPNTSPSAAPLPSPTASAAPVKEASAGALITAAVISIMAIIAAIIAAIVITSKRNKKKSRRSKQ